MHYNVVGKIMIRQSVLGSLANRKYHIAITNWAGCWNDHENMESSLSLLIDS